jgi:hypothetical protein
MPRYRVTLRRSSVEIVEASNQYQAAIVARDKFGDSVEVADVRPAVGRPAVSTGRAAKKAGKKVAKKRRPLSPEARAKLAQNLVKARAARAAKAKAAKRTSKSTKKATKKTAKRSTKKR